jgi:hypothetical protein
LTPANARRAGAVDAAAVPNAGNAVNAGNVETGAREAPGKAAKAGKAGNSVHAAASAHHAATKRLKARQLPRRRVRSVPAEVIGVIGRNAATVQSATPSHPSTRAPDWWTALSARPPVRLQKPIVKAVGAAAGAAVADGTVTRRALKTRS